MALNPSETEILRLVRMYRATIRQLANEFVANVSLDIQDLAERVRRANIALDDLDQKTERWARRSIAAFFDAVRRETSNRLSSMGVRRWNAKRSRLFLRINKQAIYNLLYDPDSGFLTSLRAATNQIRQRLSSILAAARTVRAQEEAVQASAMSVTEASEAMQDELEAGLSFLSQGQVEKSSKRAALLLALGTMKLQTAGRDSLNTAAARLAAEMRGSRALSDRVWKRRYDALGQRSLFYQLGHLTLVRLPGPSGDQRDWSIDSYAEVVARLKTHQAASIARRNAILESGNSVLRVANTLAKKDDACNLYIGRAYALTREAATTLDIAHVDDLPEGGVPFHPNCTHSELVCVLKEYSEEERARILTKPPAWSLGKRWRDVEAEYRKRGGMAYAERVNPNIATAGPPAKGIGTTFRKRGNK